MNSKDIAIVAVFAMASVLAVVSLLRPVLRAWAQRIGGPAADAALTDEVGELRARVAELEGSETRFQELEERLDFAERMLAQRVDVPRLQRHDTPV